MNIACDARALVGPQTGVGTWTTQVMGGLARAPQHRIFLAASRPVTLPPELDTAGVRMIPFPRIPWPGSLWLHAALSKNLAAADVEVFIGALGVLPRRCPAPGILVVHDITPRTHPHRHTLANRFCFNAYLEESLEQAASVVAVSAATAAELARTFPWVADRVLVIPNGVDPYFCPPEADEDGDAIRPRSTTGNPYVLHLGTLEPRKGLITLIEAWERIRARADQPLDLILAGGEGWHMKALRQRIAHSRWRSSIYMPGYVTRDDARSLMRHASAFVLASEVEGFGLPLAEAIACGAPCVASDIPSLRETGGDAALYSPPGDAEGLAAAILRSLDPTRAAELRARAIVRAGALRWDPVVRRWLELLDSVVTPS